MRAEVHEAKVCERWSSSSQPLENSDADLRGRTVRDPEGREIGPIDDLFVDPDSGEVRFLEVATGGILGMGKKHHLVPVDVVQSVQDGSVELGVPAEAVTQSPEYADEFIPEVEMDHYADVYAHYNVQPYWQDGYVYPRFPTTTS